MMVRGPFYSLQNLLATENVKLSPTNRRPIPAA